MINANSNTTLVSNSSSNPSLSSLGHLSETSTSSTSCAIHQIDLVDTVYRFDPSKNEWSTCKSMLRKRAFHHSVSLSDSTRNTTDNRNIISKEKYIFLFYGLCYSDDSNPSSTQQNSDNPSNNTPQEQFSIANGSLNSRIVQCNAIEFYNIETDTWSILTQDNALLTHHLYQPYRIPVTTPDRLG